MNLFSKKTDPLAVIERPAFDVDRRGGRSQFWCNQCSWKVDDYGDAGADAPGRAADHAANSGHRVSGEVNFTVSIQNKRIS